MTFEEYKRKVPELERRADHECNGRCHHPVHYDLVYEIGDVLTEDSLLNEYGKFALRILSAKRVLEYPSKVPGTDVATTGAWGIEYYSKLDVEGIESYIDALINVLEWRTT